MIRKIEVKLRADIRLLSKEARKYKAGIFRNGDIHKYSNAIIQIRKNNVLLKKLFLMAKDALKKLFVQIFKPKATWGDANPAPSNRPSAKHLDLCHMRIYEYFSEDYK